MPWSPSPSPHPPDLGKGLALWNVLSGRVFRQNGPSPRRGLAWNILGCLIPLAIFLVLFAIVWFAGLHNAFFPTR